MQAIVRGHPCPACPPREQCKVCVLHTVAGMTLCKTARFGDVDMRRSEAAQHTGGRCACSAKLHTLMR